MIPGDLLDALVALISALTGFVVVFTVHFAAKLRLGDLMSNQDIRVLAVMRKMNNDQIDGLVKLLEAVRQPAELPAATPAEPAREVSR